MTFTEIQNRVLDRANLTSAAATTRVGKSINECYREVAGTIGLASVERGTSQATSIVGNRALTFAFPSVTITATTFVPTSAGSTMTWGALSTVLVPTAGSAITFDNAASGGSSTNVSTKTVSYTVGGTANFLLAGIVGDATTDLVTSVTYNGVAMVLLGKALVGSNWLYLYGLTAPTTGAHNLIITASANCSILGSEIASYIGVSAVYYQTIVSASSAVSSASISTTITSPVTACWAVQFSRNSAGTLYTATALGGGTTATVRASQQTDGLASLVDSGAISGGVQKLLSVYNTAFTPPLVLSEVSFDQLENEPLITDPPIEYAIQNITANSTTAKLNSTVSSVFTLTADVLVNLLDLSGSATPNIEEDYHDLFIYYALEIEFDKMDKDSKATKMHAKFEKRLAELRYYLMKSAYLDLIPGMNQQLTVSRNVPLV